MALYGLCAPPRGISRISARRLAPGVSAAGSARSGGGRPPSLKSSGQNVRATKAADAGVPRTVTARDDRNAIDDASKYERLSGILGVGSYGIAASPAMSERPSAAIRACRMMAGAATQTSGG